MLSFVHLFLSLSSLRHKRFMEVDESMFFVVGYPLELWGLGFCVWTNIIFSIIVMPASGSLCSL